MKEKLFEQVKRLEDNFDYQYQYNVQLIAEKKKAVSDLYTEKELNAELQNKVARATDCAEVWFWANFISWFLFIGYYLIGG